MMEQSATAANLSADLALDRTPSEAVVDAVAEAEGADPTTLPPLFDAVDPDALDSLFETTSVAPAASTAQVTFSYAGYEVTVEADGAVDLAEE